MKNNTVHTSEVGSNDKVFGKNFRMRMLPKTGNFCIVVKTEKAFVHHWFRTKIAAIRKIKELDVEGAQVYLAQASFKNFGTVKSGREQKYAAYLKCFFMDIDCGKTKAYAKQDDGIMALLTFCEITGLPEPAIVSSGNGLYAHWILSVQVKAQDWVRAAKKMQKLVKAIDPGLDKDGLIADSARILRPIHSTHRKDPNNPKPVKLLQDCKPIDFSTFEELIDKALAALAEDSVSINITRSNKNTASAVQIAEKCAVIRFFKDAKGNVPEPSWYAMIGLLRHCIEAPEIIHEWSSGHSNYSKEETDRKVEQHKYSPTTCTLFAEYYPELCDVCEHNSRIKSPIVLGFTDSVNIPDYIRELNNTHFVSRFGSKTVVCRERYDNALKRNKLEMSLFTDFRNFYCNKKVSIGLNKDNIPITAQLGKVWLEHPHRRSYEEIQLTPEGDIEGIYNLWRGFQVAPKEGSWKLMKKHILHVICCGQKKLYWYVINWLAQLVQKPWAPAEVALVLRGKKGIGKGMFVNPLCRMFGQNSMSIYNGKHLTGNFNAHLQDCILLYVDEAFWAGDKSGESVLKGLITEPTIPIERKGIDIVPVRNQLHIIMSSNNDWVVPASMDERRYCVLNVSDRYIKDLPYFKALDNEINNGGIEALLFYLQNKDISKFDIRNVPKTEGLIEQKLQSLAPVADWWHQKLIEGELLPGLGWDTVEFPELYKDYIERAQKQGIHRRVSDTAFGKQLHEELLPKGWPKKKKASSKHSSSGRVKLYQFPSIEVCRQHFENLLGVDKLDWRN